MRSGVPIVSFSAISRMATPAEVSDGLCKT
jgi:hypothetical protein